MAARKSSRLKLWWRRLKRRRAKAKANKTPKEIRTMDVILVVIAVALTAFTIEMIRIFRETGTIPDTLCVRCARRRVRRHGVDQDVKRTQEGAQVGARRS